MCILRPLVIWSNKMHLNTRCKQGLHWWLYLELMNLCLLDQCEANSIQEGISRTSFFMAGSLFSYHNGKQFATLELEFDGLTWTNSLCHQTMLLWATLKDFLSDFQMFDYKQNYVPIVGEVSVCDYDITPQPTGSIHKQPKSQLWTQEIFRNLSWSNITSQ